MLFCRQKLPEALDLALPARACSDHVAIGAYPAILGRQDVEARIIIERGTTGGKARPQALASAQYQVDRVIRNHGCAGNSAHRHAFWTFFLLPFKRLWRSATRHAQDQALLDNDLGKTEGGRVAGRNRPCTDCKCRQHGAGEQHRRRTAYHHDRGYTPFPPGCAGNLSYSSLGAIA